MGQIVGASVLARETWLVRARPPRAPSHCSGTIIGPYRIDHKIGEGSAGLVYAATHAKLGRRVALKVLREELSTNRAAVARFFGEARIVNAIAHHNIVQITDFVERNAEDGTPSYFVMELLEGQTLYDLLGTGWLDASRAIGIATQIASALSAVHAAGIVHRDLKPENVFVGPDDRVRLLDFGIAKLSTEGGLARVETAAGSLLGTPGYMAPEQALDANVDHRADVYALGVLLFEMVTGRPPFVEPDLRKMLVRHREEPAPHPNQVTLAPTRCPRPLANLIVQCLAKAPIDRPNGGAAVHERLLALSARSTPRPWALALALAVVVVAGALVAAVRWTTPIEVPIIAVTSTVVPGPEPEHETIVLKPTEVAVRRVVEVDPPSAPERPKKTTVRRVRRRRAAQPTPEPKPDPLLSPSKVLNPFEGSP